MTQDLFRHLRAHAGDDPFDQTQWWKKEQKNEMKELDARQQLMVLTMEECGELIEACSKAIRCEDYVDNERMIEEVGDVLFMVDMIMDRGLISSDDISKRMVVKKEKICQVLYF